MPPGGPVCTTSHWQRSLTRMIASLYISAHRRGPIRSAALLCAAAVLGLLVALGLARFMSFLIHASEMRLADANRTQMLDFVRVRRDESVARRDRKPERPKVDKAPESPPLDSSSNAAQSVALNVVAPTNITADLELGVGMVTGDGNYLPIVKVAPVYPRQALERGIVGDCMVRYTVTAAGTVTDVEVVEEACEVMAFRRPSIEAAKRFKYKPRVIDGAAVEVRGVRNVFHFELQEGEDRENL